MSHRGEGSIPPVAISRQRMSTDDAAEKAQSGISTASQQQPPPLHPASDVPMIVPRMADEEKSQMTMKLDKAVDKRQLAAHDVVPSLRIQLEAIFEPPTLDQADLSQTVNSRVIIIHGPTGTGKSTVIPWEAMRWLEDHCSRRGRKAGRVICSQQRRKVTISLAKEVQRRHGEVGVSTVGHHVSRDRQITDDTRLVYLTEAIGVFSLLNNRTPGVAHPLAIVIADEVHERTMYTQMIIGLTRDQMSRSTGMVLILMSATVDMEELREALPGAREIEIGKHEFKVDRFYLQRPVTQSTNILEQTARLVVTLHHKHGNENLVEGVPSGQYCDNFLVFCPGKPQMKILASMLIRWQELGYTRGLEIVQMSSGEDPRTWEYFDMPVKDYSVMGRDQPYYMHPNGIVKLKPHSGKNGVQQPPYADNDIVVQHSHVIKRRRKVGLTTNVNQTGATLTSVAVVISTTGVRTCSPNLRSKEEVNCIQTVSVSDLIQQGGRAGRVCPGEHYVMASESQVVGQFRGASAPELLNADVAPLISICKRINIDPLNFPILNMPDGKVLAAATQRMRMLELLDDNGELTHLGQSRLVLDYTPEWARFIAKALEYGVSEGAIRIAAVLCREEDMCTSHVRESLSHVDGDVMTILHLVWLAEGILKRYHIKRIQALTNHDAAKATLERAGLQVKGVMQVMQNIEQLHESIAQSDLPRGPLRSPSDKYYATLLVHALWEGFHMNVMIKSFTGQYVSPTFGGEWSISKTTLQYAPLVVLPLKKTIIDGCPFLQWITPLPVEWLVERDWWIQTHWEDNDCRMVYRNLVACPILRDMLSTARLYPGGRVKIIELKAVPAVKEEPPMAVTIDNCAVMLTRYLLTARELEIIYDLVSSDYLVSAYVTGSYVSNNTVKNEVNMQVLKWTVSSHKSKKTYKLNTIDKPSVQVLGAYALIPREDYHQDAWLKGGREVQLKSNAEDLALARTLGSIEDSALEETNMFQTDARDLAADREAEEHEDNFDCYGEKEVSSMDYIFKENEKLIRCREGHQTYGYCAWCDAPIGNPNKLWRHYLDVHQVLMQVAPMSPPSVWQTLMGREMGARTPQFQTPQGQYKYWVQPAKRDGIDSFVIGSTQRGNDTLVSLGELLLAGNGALPLVATCPATTTLSPRQKPPNCVKVFLGGTDYWSKVKMYDVNTLLSIGTPVTSDMAFLTMFSEWGNILGGKQAGRGEYSSQELYGIRRYPDTLRMMSQEVEDVMKSQVAPLDVLRIRVPHCSMPAPEADQARITPAYHEDKGEAREFLRCALAARQRYGYFDCSTCPERLIYDHLWLDGSEYVADSKLPSNPFANQWSFADSTEHEKWKWMLHVDIWSVAQEIQRKGVEAEIIFLEMARRDSGRRVWPVSLVRHPVPNEASSNAVRKALDKYPWVDSGLRWKGTMVYTESPGEDRSTLFESARKPGVNPQSGPASSSQDASTSPAPPAKAMPGALSKADSSTGKAASSGKPASEPDAKDKSQGTSLPKSSAPTKAMSDSGISHPTKEQDKSAEPIASSAAASQSTPSPKPASSVASTKAATDPVPKAKASSEAASMSAPTVRPTGGSEAGVQSASRAPSGAASQSSVTAGSGYPTIAESLGQKKNPPLKAAPSSKGTAAPSSKSEDTGPAAAKGSITAKPAAEKGSTTAPSVVKEEETSQAPATTSTSKEQETDKPARAPRAPDVQAPVEKDAAMSYTEQVMKQAASAVPTSKLTDEEYERLAQERWQKMLVESATSVSSRATSVAHLPKELRGEMLPPQPLFSPIRGWIDGLTPPVHKEGRTIELSLPGVVGIFKWTFLAESRQQKRPVRKRVARSSPEQLGMDGLIMITDRSTGDRIPWNTGVKHELERGAYAVAYERENALPEDKKIILHMQPISYLSDANKIAWIRAFLGWAYKAVMIQDVDPQVEMSVHSGLVHFLTEMYSRVSVKGAKPLSEIGQGIPVYAGGQEIRTGREGLMTSDWGNQLFIAAGRKIVDSLFTGASSKKDSDLGDRMESAFNLSFWEKEGAFDWSWLGLDLVNERMTDELLASLEWSCYRESEAQMIQTF